MQGENETKAAFPVMVLAHNEERHIEACLDSIFQADPGRSFDVYVMANGCTDRTEAIVRDYALRQPSVHLVSIALGDKCNAWNVFIHETVQACCPGRPIYFFVDGDARFVPGSFSAMEKALAADPVANAVGAPPASGRSAEPDRRELLEERGLVANLYALRGRFVERLIAARARIPLGLEGDDGLIGALVRWDLDPQHPMDSRFITPCADAGFIFESMTPARLADWRAYWKRMIRYARRRYEFALLGERLRAQGLAGMPQHIQELYAGANKLRLTWDGIYTLTSWIALTQMRRIGRERGGAH